MINMKKEDIEKILKQMVIELAKEFNYKKGHEDKRKSKNTFGFSYFQIENEYYYVQYGTTNKTNNKRNGGSIELRYRFGHPRLDVYLPNKKGFASLEFSDFDNETREHTGIWNYSESQIFYEQGIELFNKIYNRFFELKNGDD